MNAYDAATGCHSRAIERTITSVDELLTVHRRQDDYRTILGSIRAELSAALDWRIANRSDVDEASDRYQVELEHASDTAYAVELVRSAIRSFGPGWRGTVPLTAWKARAYVHLSILETEHDPASLAAALDRIYPERAA